MDAFPFRRSQGFSLLELVVVIALTGVLAAAAVQPLIQALNARARVAANLEAIDGLRYATLRVVRELRQARYEAAAGAAFQVKATDAASAAATGSAGICFRRSGGVDGNAQATVAVRQSGGSVTLDSGTSLPACAATSPSQLAARVTGLRFDYWAYGNGGAGAAPVALAVGDPNFATLLSFVDVTLTVASADGAPVSYRTRVALRNGPWGAAK